VTRRTTSLVAVAAGLTALGGGGVAIAAGSGTDPERPISGSTIERARAVALHTVGGGRVTATEAGGEEGAYEVEVARRDGSTVDIHLDARLAVIDVSPDGRADPQGR
jgi:hypothetical protein